MIEEASPHLLEHTNSPPRSAARAVPAIHAIRVQGTIHAAQGTHRPRDADAPDDAPPRLASAAPHTSLVSSIAIT